MFLEISGVFVMLAVLVFIAAATRWVALRRGRKPGVLVAAAIWIVFAVAAVLLMDQNVTFAIFTVIAVTAALGPVFAAALVLPMAESKKLFALVSVLSAVAGIALFFGIMTIAVLSDYRGRHMMSEVVLTLDMVRRDINEFYREHQRLPKDAAEAKLNLDSASRYVSQVVYDGTTGELRGVVKGIPDNEGKTLVFKAEVSGKELKWACYSRDIHNRELPRSCQTR